MIWHSNFQGPGHLQVFVTPPGLGRESLQSPLPHLPALDSHTGPAARHVVPRRTKPVRGSQHYLASCSYIISSNIRAHNPNSWDLLMPTLVKMDARGRVTLPKALRIALRLSSGERLTFSQLDDGTVILSPKGMALPQPVRIVTKPSQPEAIGEGANEVPITKR